jgi:hypothetical protein
MATGCGGPFRSVAYDAGRDAAWSDGLYRVQARGVKAAFLKPGASFSAYDAAVLDDFTIAYESPPRAATEFNRRQGNFAWSDETVARVKRICGDAFADSLASTANLRLQPDPGPGALRVTGQLVDLVVDEIPPGTDEDVFAVTAGQMTLLLNVRDSQSGELLMRVADRRELRPESSFIFGYRADWASVWTSVRQHCTGWSDFVGDALAYLHDAGPVLGDAPPPPTAPATP